MDDVVALSAEFRDEYAKLRDELARQRDEIARLRDDVARDRDRAALERARQAEQAEGDDAVDLIDLTAGVDEQGARRDRAADRRDRVAADRDRVDDVSETAPSAGALDGTEVTTRAGASRQAAALDRLRAAEDRTAAALERSHSRVERSRSADDRSASAKERVEAASDRSYAHADRTASATERTTASFDTVTAELWRAAIAQAPLGVMEFDDDGTIVSANPALHRLLDYPDGQLEGRNYVSEVVHPDQRDQSAQVLAHHVARGAGTHSEVQRHLVTATGAHRWVLGTEVRISSADGAPDRMIGFLLDATAARLDRQRLAEANARFEKLLQFSTDAILVLNAGVALYASPGLAAVTGSTSASAVGASVRTLFHPDDVPAIEAMLVEITNGAVAVIGFTARVAHVDGRWRHVEATASDQAGDPAIGGTVVNMRDVTDRLDVVNRLAHQATHDDLTGLPNRSLLLKLLEQALARAARFGKPCAALFLDLDHFKDVNDTFGHDVGDTVLTATAERLRALVRPGDSAARLGGDEFVVVAEDVDDPVVALALAERIRAGIARPVSLPGGGTIGVSCSIGIARSAVLAPETLLREADEALYRAKALGRDRSEG
ncbi:MAG: diguanylate cyclase [Mycobacteriales bacterium]|nr:diguanylate cyclase [Mycobacteriales bacterium]